MGRQIWLFFACIMLSFASGALHATEFHPSPEDIEGGFIQHETPVFDLPARQGERYDDTAPDTLDLAAMAELALNGLTGPNDPEAGYEMYFTVNMQRNPPIMLHDFSDGCQVKFLGPLLLLRTITGSDTGLETERKIFTAYLRSIGPDGLWHPPLKGRKWYRENLWDEAKGNTPENAEPPAFEGGRMHGRIVEALLIFWKLTGDGRWKDMADAMVTNGVNGNLERFVRETNDWGVAPGTAENAVPKGFLACDAWTIQALAQTYRLTGNDLVKQAARKMLNHQKDHIDFFESSGKFILTTPGVAPAHFHVHALSILGFLEYGLAAREPDIIDYVKRSYEWARTQGSVSTGFFPENIKPDCPNSEGCAVADMIALALKLSQAGIGDYWDDADRWLRNAFAEFQLTPEKARQLAEAAKKRPEQEPRYNETSDRVIERNIGAFAGWPGPNEWVRKIGIQHCCTGNCTRTLYYAWESILDHDNNPLRVNLLLNRASPWADVYSCIPNEGRVELRIKVACADVLLRVPEWIASGSNNVQCKVGDFERAVAWEGRYVRLGPAANGDRFVVTFPIGERMVKEHFGNGDYALTIRGTTVIAIDPPGLVCPLYQRNGCRAEKAHWSPVHRFVANNPIDW
jgi:hypothetical protein